MSRKSKSDQMIDEHISRAMFQLRKSEGTAKEADALWEIPVEKATGNEWYLQGTSSYTGQAGEDSQKTEKKSKSIIRRFGRSELYRMVLATAAAVMLIAGISYYQYFIRIDATVCLDINPSVTLSENRVGRVVSAEANNSDAEAVLSETEPEGKKTDEAVEDILNLMVEQGYISDDDSTVLVSVECGNSTRTAMKVKEMTEIVGNCIKNDTTEGSVFSQTISMNDEVWEFAREKSISPGKASLVLQLAKDHPDMNAGELAELPMNDLVSYLHGQNVDLRDVIDYKGADLDARWQKEAEEEQKQSQGKPGTGSDSDGSRNQEERGASEGSNSANAGTGSMNNSGPAGNVAAEGGQEAANNPAGTNDQNAANGQSGTNEPNAVNGQADTNGVNSASNETGTNGPNAADDPAGTNDANGTNGPAGTNNPNAAGGQADTNNRNVADGQAGANDANGRNNPNAANRQENENNGNNANTRSSMGTPGNADIQGKAAPGA